jgi:hypothetical protein
MEVMVVGEAWESRVLVQYHMGYIALHCPRLSLLAVAGDVRFTRRANSDCYREMVEWAAGIPGQVAVWHAVQMLLRVLGKEEATGWPVYLAGLVCHVFGNMGDDTGEETWNPEGEMRGVQYLNVMNTPSWEGIGHVRPMERRRTRGLLIMLKHNMVKRGLGTESWNVLDRLSGGRGKSE